MVRVKVGLAYEIEFKSNQPSYSYHFSQVHFFSMSSFVIQGTDMKAELIPQCRTYTTGISVKANQKKKMLITTWCIIRIHSHICIKCKSFHMGLLSPEAMLFTCNTLHKVFFSSNPPGKLVMKHEKLLWHTWMHLRSYRWHLYCFITHTFCRYCTLWACLCMF